MEVILECHSPFSPKFRTTLASPAPNIAPSSFLDLRGEVTSWSDTTARALSPEPIPLAELCQAPPASPPSLNILHPYGSLTNLTPGPVLNSGIENYIRHIVCKGLISVPPASSHCPKIKYSSSLFICNPTFQALSNPSWTLAQKYWMENSRNKQFLNFKLCVLSSVMKFCTILLHPTRDVTSLCPVCARCIRYLPVSVGKTCSTQLTPEHMWTGVPTLCRVKNAHVNLQSALMPTTLNPWVQPIPDHKAPQGLLLKSSEELPRGPVRT